MNAGREVHFVLQCIPRAQPMRSGAVVPRPPLVQVFRLIRSVATNGDVFWYQDQHCIVPCRLAGHAQPQSWIESSSATRIVSPEAFDTTSSLNSDVVGSGWLARLPAKADNNQMDRAPSAVIFISFGLPQ